MATLAATVATAVAAGGLSNKVLSGLIDGRLKCMLEDYTIGGSTEVSGSTIDIGGIIPKGANVVAIIIYVSTNQTALTLSVGDDESATRYANAITSLQTAGTYLIGGQNYVVDMTTPSTPDNQIVLTTGGATMTAGTLKVAVIYSID